MCCIIKKFWFWIHCTFVNYADVFRLSCNNWEPRLWENHLLTIIGNCLLHLFTDMNISLKLPNVYQKINTIATKPRTRKFNNKMFVVVAH